MGGTAGCFCRWGTEGRAWGQTLGRYTSRALIEFIGRQLHGAGGQSHGEGGAAAPTPAPAAGLGRYNTAHGVKPMLEVLRYVYFRFGRHHSWDILLPLTRYVIQSTAPSPHPT